MRLYADDAHGGHHCVVLVYSCDYPSNAKESC
jgi:hypothetical protein